MSACLMFVDVGEKSRGAAWPQILYRPLSFHTSLVLHCDLISFTLKGITFFFFFPPPIFNESLMKSFMSQS